jgi:catechol 2,3-dioxygenase-like lactoylglutathione lyase family enzyme
MAETEAEASQVQADQAQAITGQLDPCPADGAQVDVGQANGAQAAAGQADVDQADAGQAAADEVSAGVVTAGQADAQYGAGQEQVPADLPPLGAIHHVELWVPNLDRAIVSWGWLLTALGYRMFQDWPGGRSWQSGHAYIVVEQSPARTASRHDRCRPGLNHLAFHVPSRQQVDELTGEALLHGWRLMFSDVHPYAGGPQHYAAYLENADGFEVELVAD